MSPLPGEDFAAFFRATSAYVWSSLRRLGVGVADLEDQSHETFLAMYRHRAAFDAARPLRPWVFAFALRVAADYRKQAWHRRRPETLTHEPPATTPAADDLVAERQQREMIHEALDALDLDRRAVLVMHELDGEAIPVVAQTLEIPLNTAYSRLRSAREQFSAALKRAQARRGEP